MNEHTEKQLSRFMSVLKHMGLTKEEIFGICSMMKTEEMPWEIMQELKARNFIASKQETMNICGQVISKYLTK